MSKGLHVRRRPIFRPKSSEEQKKALTRFMSYALFRRFRPPFAFRPRGGDIAHFEKHCTKPRC